MVNRTEEDRFEWSALAIALLFTALLTILAYGMWSANRTEAASGAGKALPAQAQSLDEAARVRR